MKAKKIFFLIILTLIVVSFSGYAFLYNGYRISTINSISFQQMQMENISACNVNLKIMKNDKPLHPFYIYSKGINKSFLPGLISSMSVEAPIEQFEINSNEVSHIDAQKCSPKPKDNILSFIDVVPSSITLMETYSSFMTENTLKITATYSDGSKKPIALNECVYESNNQNVAFVGHTGIISGTSKGIAEILVSYTEDDVTKKDTVKVFVTPFIAGDD